MLHRYGGRNIVKGYECPFKFKAAKPRYYDFIEPEYNEVVSLYTHGKRRWSQEQFAEFLAERVVSRDRRDIERILFRCGLSRYDVLRIA